MIKILVVDDSHVQREIIGNILRNRKIEVTEAENGAIAKEILKQDNKFNLIITDVVMPEMNGYQLCRWIKDNPNTKRTPVLMCSTKGEEFDLHWAEKQGADAYITKPFQEKDLLQTIKYLINLFKNRNKTNS